jgi:hypothetical protein
MQAGGTVQLIDIGNFVRVLEAQNAITLRTYKSGQVKTESEGVFGGYAEQFQDDFEKVEIYSATAQTVQIVIRLGSIVSYDVSPTGNVSITSPAHGTGTNAQKTVTNVSASLVAANAARKVLQIQNKDAAGNVYICYGAAATVANGILIPPKGFYELAANMLTAEIFAIGDIANNPNIVVVEG